MSQTRLLQIALLAALALSEEQSILDGATMIQRDLNPLYTFNANAVCDGGFKSYSETTGSDVSSGMGHKEIVIALSEAKSIKSAFVQNMSNSTGFKKRMGESAVFVGNDTGAFSAGMTKCSDDFFDSGFYSMNCHTKGKNVAVRRNGHSAGGDIYTINEVRLYQTPNLLEFADVTISAPAPTAPQWAATNLITNFSRRTAGNNLKPLIDWAGTTASWESCFKTGAAQLSVEGNKLIINVDLKKSYFQHAILAVQDLFNGWQVSAVNDPLKFFQNYEIFIGDSPNYAENRKCPDGPHMQVGDPKSYVNVTTNLDSYTGPMWRFGKEIWCNMEGRFMTIVADLTHLAGQPYEMNLCHLAVFGASYKRTIPVPPTLKLLSGSRFELDVEKITADETTPIANTLDIMLRQKAGSELPWVTFTQDTLVTKVNIAPDSSVPSGDYTVVLESFDKAGGVFSTLKTDTITVTVEGCPVTAKQIDALDESLAVDPINISVAAQQVGSAKKQFQHKYQQVVGQLVIDDMERQCGPISINLVSKHAFLLHVPNTKTLFLRAENSTAPGVYDDSYLQLRVQSYSLKIPIRAEFTGCVVTSVSFEQPKLSSHYQVASGSHHFQLPEVVQRPNCDSVFQHLYVKKIDPGSLSPDAVHKAVKLDHGAHTLVVETEDASFVGKQVSVTVAIEAPDIKRVDDLLVTLDFVDAEASASKDLADDLVTLKYDARLGASLGIPGLVVPPVTKEQAHIVATPVSKLTGEQLFASVPLAAWLTQGVETVDELRLRQRDSQIQKLDSHAKNGQPRPPEVRLDSFSAQGVVKFKFTQKIGFPGNVTATVRQQIAQSQTSDRQRVQSPVQIFAFHGEHGDKGDAVEPLMESWELVALDEDGLEFKVHFFSPLQVSAGNEPDFLLVQMLLSNYKDENGNSLPLGIILRILIPRQFASLAEAAIVSDFAATQIWATVGSIFLNLVTAQSLSHLWSIVNSLQVVLLLSLFSALIPGNVCTFNDYFSDMTSIKVVKSATKLVVNSLFYFPQRDPKTLNFQNAGHDSPFFIENAQEMLSLKTLFVCLPLLSLPLWLAAKCSDRAARWRQKLHELLFWNGYIRLLTETYAEITLFVLLNFNEMQFPKDDSTSETLNNIVTIAVSVIFTIGPIALSISRAKGSVEEKPIIETSTGQIPVKCNTKRQVATIPPRIESSAKTSASSAGTTSKQDRKKCTVFLLTFAFFVRRLALSLTLVFWSDFLFGQVVVQLLMSTAMIIFLVQARPMETPEANNLEIFNEAFGVLVIVFVMLFSPFVPEPETRNWIGIGYIVCLSSFAAVRIFLLWWKVQEKHKLWLRLKRWAYHAGCCLCCFRRTRRRQSQAPKKQLTQIEEQLQKDANLQLGSHGPLRLSAISEASEQLEKEADEDDEERGGRIGRRKSSSAKPMGHSRSRENRAEDCYRNIPLTPQMPFVDVKTRNRQKVQRIEQDGPATLQRSNAAILRGADQLVNQPGAVRKVDCSPQQQLLRATNLQVKHGSLKKSVHLDRTEPEVVQREDNVNQEPFIEEQVEEALKEFDLKYEQFRQCYQAHTTKLTMTPKTPSFESIAKGLTQQMLQLRQIDSQMYQKEDSNHRLPYRGNISLPSATVLPSYFTLTDDCCEPEQLPVKQLDHFKAHPIAPYSFATMNLNGTSVYTQQTIPGLGYNGRTFGVSRRINDHSNQGALSYSRHGQPSAEPESELSGAGVPTAYRQRVSKEF